MRVIHKTKRFSISRTFTICITHLCDTVIALCSCSPLVTNTVLVVPSVLQCRRSVVAR